MLPAKLIAACWLVFLAYWAINARSVKSAAEVQTVPQRLAHRVPVSIGVLLLWFGSAHRSGIAMLPHTPAVEWSGAAICALGVAFAIWARRTIAANWSGDVQFKQGHELVQRGPYRWVRHPIYTGILLMCLGAAIGRGTPVAFAGVAFFFIGFWIKLRQEERLMLRHFPDEYPAYRARVKALVPFVF